MRRDPGPEALRRWIDRAAARDPDKPYLVSLEDGRAMSYAELARTTGRIAAHFAARGIGANARVALLAGNSPEHLAVYLGVLAAGATICTVHVEANRPHLDAILQALAPCLVIHEESLELAEFAARTNAPWRPLGRWDDGGGTGFFADLPAEGAAPSPRAMPTDDAVILFTSGTTALPKGVVLTYREMLGNAAAAADGFGIGPDDRVYDYRSFNWASAQLLGALATLSAGATLLLRRRFSRSRFFADLARFGATIAAGNPTVIGLLLRAEEPAGRVDLPDFRFMTSSSAPLLEDEWRRFEQRFGIAVAQGYGTSETGWVATCTGATRRFGTVGRPLAHLELAIVDEAGRALAAGEVGHVEVGGLDGNRYRYIGEDGAVRIAAVGRARTGDMGFLDADGYLHLTGRERDLIIRGGVNIAPVEIDAVLTGIAGVAEAATVGVPDPIYGEEVVSYVVLAPGTRMGAADILARCGERLPAFKAPKHIVVRGSLPRTDRGKLDRGALAREWPGGDLPSL